jgi:general secretion pathway protein J
MKKYLNVPFVHPNTTRLQSLKGFTLIEILIALAVFAILSTITSSVLYNAFTTRTRVNEQSVYLNKLELAISLIQQDTLQILERAIRGNEMRLFPLFIGQSDYVEFTRDGNVNPNSSEKRSTLKRIAYTCQKGVLIRRTWNSLDSLDRTTYQDKVLLEQLDECHFSYLNQTLQVLPEWREQALNQNQRRETLPKAIQVNMTLRAHGEINLLFTIPEALYASN